MNDKYIELKNQIEKAENIIIFSHVNPDGDTLGSNLALNLMIEKFYGKKPKSVYVGILPNIYLYLPEYSRFENASELDKSFQYDLAIAVDVASKDRMVSAVEIYDNAKFKVNIDHHVTNIGYGDLNIIDGNAACVGLILYRIFKDLGYTPDINVARCLYTSLMTDTGCFKYDSTTPEAFMTAAELVKLGVSPANEYRACYETKPQSMIQFQACIVSNTQFYNNGKIAFVKVTRNDMLKFNAEDDYTEGIVEIIRSSRDVEIAAILKETKENHTKVSLRSKNTDLTSIVSDFGGGGHKYSAGCTIKKPLSIAYDRLLERVKSEIK